MMVLSRQRDESIMIGDDIEIIIVSARDDKVRLGITAPKGMPIHRREIYDAIQREKKIEQLKGKKLGDLVDEMLQLVVKEPDILTNPDYKGQNKQLYEAYRSDISRRQEAGY